MSVVISDFIKNLKIEIVDLLREDLENGLRSAGDRRIRERRARARSRTNEDRRKGERRSRLFGRFLINYRLQFRMSLFLLSSIFIAIIVVWVEGTAAILWLIEKGGLNDEVMIGHLEWVNQLYLISLFCLMLLGFLFSLFLSNRVAGPIYRFEQIFRELAKGNLDQKVHIRDHDELQETAQLLDEAIAGLRHKYLKKKAADSKKGN